MKCPKCGRANLAFGDVLKNKLTRADKDKIDDFGKGATAEFKCLDCKHIQIYFQAVCSFYYSIEDSNNILRYTQLLLEDNKVSSKLISLVMKNLEIFVGKRITIQTLSINTSEIDKYEVRELFELYSKPGTNGSVMGIVSKIADRLIIEKETEIMTDLVKEIEKWKRHRKSGVTDIYFDKDKDKVHYMNTLYTALFENDIDLDIIDNVLDGLSHFIGMTLTVQPLPSDPKEESIWVARELYRKLKFHHPLKGKGYLENIIAKKINKSKQQVERYLKDWKRSI